MIEEVRLTDTDTGIGQWLVDLLWLSLTPLSIFVVLPLLGDLTDVDLGVEVGSEGLVVVTAIAVYDVEIVDLVEVVLRSISREYPRDPWVEATA